MLAMVRYRYSERASRNDIFIVQIFHDVSVRGSVKNHPIMYYITFQYTMYLTVHFARSRLEPMKLLHSQE